MVAMSSEPPPEVMRAFAIEEGSPQLLSHRVNTHWVVRAGGQRNVLRRFGQATESGVDWELDVARRIAELGWPVPCPVGAPLRLANSLWALFPYFKGRDLRSGGMTNTKCRKIGRLLAEFHATVACSPCPTQRPGWTSFIDSTLPVGGSRSKRSSLLALLSNADPDLHQTICKTLAELEQRDLPALFADAPRQIVHGDFTGWNLRFNSGQLSAVLDFELSHVDVAAADLACAWRGSHEAVVSGYLERVSLPETHLAALDGLWISSLFASAWRVLEAAECKGSLAIGALAWEAEQFAKMRPLT